MDYLGYHYLAGMIYIGCKAWEKAREMLLAAISMPGPSVSAVQIAAFKKLVLVDLIVSGEVRNYGKIVSGPLTAAFTLHGRAYTDLGSAYRDLDYGKLKKVLEKDVKYYQQDQNYGLLMSVYESIPARRLINLTETYVRMDMQKLAEKISKGSFTELNAQGAEELVVKLVKEGRLHARISHPEGKVAEVSFIEDPELYNTPATIDRIGVEMNSIKQMESMLKGLEQAWSMHEGWLKETLRKEKDKSRNFDGPGGPPGRGEQDAGLRAAVEAAGLGGGNVRGVGANWADAGF
ncbi:hypothetical protein QFC22_006285 [Naganishia vaughanmartiniae]|uniref:Uncharacterized protein n=1 Tax=Naganishia vaughanmartiniae TaxID=1424756 RepID=A0ACC2WM33_9TREE|nr:hypothetical protein QFC22_006285 [Naganishia vaughanmartiniae]